MLLQPRKQDSVASTGGIPRAGGLGPPALPPQPPGLMPAVHKTASQVGRDPIMVHYLPNHSAGVGILGYPHGGAFPPTMDLIDKVILLLGRQESGSPGQQTCLTLSHGLPRTLTGFCHIMHIYSICNELKCSSLSLKHFIYLSIF